MALGHLNTHDANILGVRDTSLVKDSLEQVFIYRTQNKMGGYYLVLSPDNHALREKDSLEQLLQILGPVMKRLFHSKSKFVITNVISCQSGDKTR